MKSPCIIFSPQGSPFAVRKFFQYPYNNLSHKESLCLLETFSALLSVVGD